AVVNNLEDAHELIDTAISTALKASKPVNISISCNLPAIPHPIFGSDPVRFTLSPKLSNKMGLEAAVEAAAEFLNKDKTIIVQPDRVSITNGLKHDNTAYENYHRIFVPVGHPLKTVEPKQPLRVDVLLQYIQNMLSSETTIFAEAGDSWFNYQKLKLPTGCGYEFQMQHGSIGWSVGATLGYAQAVPEKREIACISDGSFQVTAQDVPAMLRCGQKSITFLINNGGYTIEVETHDRPYHVIKNWNYTGLVEAIHTKGKCWTAKVCCEEELIKAIERATGAMKDCLCFIEVIVHKDDTSKELLEWGCRVAATNGRPPYPQ
ncbi:hypothetical protein Godav_000293, partial [Gossypium davidsonii]|nr:hypothetical protein [Gossypium davidsonii]